VAIIGYDDARERHAMSWDELRELVGRLQAGLRARGVGRGDVVAAYLPNIPETLALMLATVGLGAVWTCCSPETGPDGALDRLVQTNPTVLVTVDGYRYGERVRDARGDVGAILAGLPTVRHALSLDLLGWGRPGRAGRRGPISWLQTAVLFLRARRLWITRSTSCTHRVRPANQRPSSTVMVASCSST